MKINIFNYFLFKIIKFKDFIIYLIFKYFNVLLIIFVFQNTNNKSKNHYSKIIFEIILIRKNMTYIE